MIIVGFGSNAIYHVQEGRKKKELEGKLNHAVELATRRDFRPLADELTQKVKVDLKAVYGEYQYLQPKVTVTFRKGNKERQLLAQELAALLDSAGFPVRIQPYRHLGETKTYLFFNPQDVKLARDVMGALIPRAVNATVAEKEAEHFLPGQLEFRFNATPEFLSNSQVVLGEQDF